VPHERRTDQMRASLDGEASASAVPRPTTPPEPAFRRPRDEGVWRSAVLAEPRTTAPPRCTSRMAALSTTFRARDPTSDVLSSGRPRTGYCYPTPFASSRVGPAASWSRQRPKLVLDPDAFHRRMLPPPSTLRPMQRFRAESGFVCGITRSRRPCRNVRTGGFRHRDRAFGTFSPPLSTPPLDGAARRARPMVFRPGPCAARRLLQSNATCEHDHAIVRTPAGGAGLAGVRLRAPRTLPFGGALALPARR